MDCRFAGWWGLTFWGVTGYSAAMFTDAFGYPTRNGGWAMILTGAVMAVLLDVATIVPVLGLAVALFSAGYFGGFYLDIVGSTMTGNDRMPDWPSFTDFMDDIVAPFVRLLGLVIVSFAAAAAVFFLMEPETDEFWWAFGGAVAFGCFYFPMAVLGSVAAGNLVGALPHVVLPAIFRCLPGYLVVVTGLVVAVVACAVVEEFGGRVPYVGWFVAAVVALYSMMAQGRLIGLIYRAKSEALGW